MADNRLTLLAAKSTWVPQADRVVVGNEEIGVTGGPALSITSHSLSMCNALATTDLTQEMVDEEKNKKVK